MRSSLDRWPAVVSLVLFARGIALAQLPDVPVHNWTVPPYRGSNASGTISTMTDVSPGIGFVAVAPCRVADTRGNGAPIQGGIFSNSQARDWSVWGICGIPPGADAISVNFTVTGSPLSTPSGAFLLAWPTGQAPPPTAIMTYGPAQTISNAAIVPLNPSGVMTVNVSHSTHVIMDVNGYFTDLYLAGVQFVVSANVPAQGAIYGHNRETGGSGAGGFFTHAGSGYGVYAAALGTSGGSRGVTGVTYSTTDASIGVQGVAIGSTGTTYGVWGQTNSVNFGSGVFGVDGGGVTQAHGSFLRSGVRGESTQTGILGLTEGNLGEGNGSEGVRGEILTRDPPFVEVAGGILAYNAGLFGYGVYARGDYGGGGMKMFVEPHPEKADMVIRYVSLEGNESGTYFRGRGKFQNGLATIEVPEDFRLVTDRENLSIQVTPIGEMATVAVKSIGLDRIVVRGSRNVEFFYTVNGVRKTHKHLTPIGPGREYMPRAPDAKMPLYLTEGQKEMLISNGTYNPDGTVNLETARRLGWDKEWEKRGRPTPQSVE